MCKFQFIEQISTAPKPSPGGRVAKIFDFGRVRNGDI